MLHIRSYPAHNGDAFLIKANDRQPTAVLIDGGYPGTFHGHIRADLQELARNGYCLDLVVATHIDSDHVSGLVPFFRANGLAQAPKIIRVGHVFHNSLRGLARVAAQPAATAPADLELLQEIQRAGYPQATAETRAGEEISARQGSSLAALLNAGGYLWNGGDGTRCIDGEDLKSHAIGGGEVTVLGPPRTRLEELLTYWTSEIRSYGYTGPVDSNGMLDDAFEFVCAGSLPGDLGHAISGQDMSNMDLKDCHRPDDSVTNGSSISFVFEIDNRRVLFLGDGWADDAQAALRRLAGALGRIRFDAIKVSHHGSLRNTSPSLLEVIDAPRYFISTNGDGHGHPDLPVLKAIVDRPGPPRELFFNYPSAASERLKSHVSRSGAAFTVHEGATDWIALAEVT